MVSRRWKVIGAAGGALAIVVAAIIWAGSNARPADPLHTPTPLPSPSHRPTPTASATPAQPYLKKISYEAVDGGQIVVVPTNWARSQLPAPSAVDALLQEYQTKAAKPYRGEQYVWQLQCHAYFAIKKERWELESRNHRDSYLDYVSHECN